MAIEVKFAGGATLVSDGQVIEGYASRFNVKDQGGDIVMPGAFAASLARLAARGDRVRMLWQHDPARPIGVWEEVREDATGLWVRGRLLPGVALAREAAELIDAGALDGLSIGYRVVRASRDRRGLRVLTELDLWEVSLVTFPMLPDAKIEGARVRGLKSTELNQIAGIFTAAATALRAE